MTTSLDNEVKRIAEETGLTEKNILSELGKLKEEGYSDEAAMAVYKSQPEVKGRLGGRILDGATIVPFRISGPRVARTKDGNHDVLGIDVFVEVDESWEAKTISLWDEKANNENGLYEVGKPLTAKLKLRDEVDRVSLLEEPNASTKPVPSTEEMMKNIGTVAVQDIPGLSGQNVFVKGIVGRTFTTERGGGIELSAIGANPVTVFLEGETNAKLGDEVVVAGYVSAGKGGDVRISGGSVMS